MATKKIGTYLAKEEKQPDEVRSMGWDFANDLVSGETIDSAVVSYLDMSDGSDVESTIKDAVHQISNGNATLSRVGVRIKAGNDGQRFNIKIIAVTNMGEEPEADIILTIKKLARS